MHIKFVAVSLWIAEKIKEILLPYSETITWFSKEGVHIINKRVECLCICYLSSYGLMQVKMSTPIHVEPLLIHQLKPSLGCSYKRSAKSQKTVWRESIGCIEFMVRIFYILVFRNCCTSFMSSWQIFFLKDQKVYIWGPTVSITTTPLFPYSRKAAVTQSWYVSKWARLWYNKIIFTKPGKNIFTKSLGHSLLTSLISSIYSKLRCGYLWHFSESQLVNLDRHAIRATVPILKDLPIAHHPLKKINNIN